MSLCRNGLNRIFKFSVAFYLSSFGLIKSKIVLIDKAFGPTLPNINCWGLQNIFQLFNPFPNDILSTFPI